MNKGDLTTLDNAKQWLAVTGLGIAAISQAFPAVITLAARAPTPLLNGGTYDLSGIVGMTQLNGTSWPITIIDPLNFSIPVDSTGYGVYTGAGYVGISDPLLQRLISACSAFIQSWLNRTIASATYVSRVNGQGMSSLVMPNYPITAVTALSVGPLSVPARGPYAVAGVPSTQNLAGFTFDDISIYLSGYSFAYGFQNVMVNYDAGFLIPNELQTIPATAPYVCTTMARWAASDRGVAYASNGVALVKVAASPAQGQYSVAGSVYTFNAADAGLGVLISYGYVPFDLEQACIDMIGDWFKYQARIGVLTQAIEQQTITFVNAALPARTLGVLQQYKRVWAS